MADDVVEKEVEDVALPGSSSMISSVVNLIKNILATSMLTMPYGTSLSGIIPSVIICVLIGCLSAYTFAEVGVLCGRTKISSYRELCEKFLGAKIGVLVDVMLAGYTLPCCIGYVCFVCDCMHAMLLELVGEHVLVSRWFIGLILSVFILIPLCSTDKIHALTWTSLIGIGAVMYCYVFVGVDLGRQDSAFVESNIRSAFWAPPSGSLLGVFPIANIYAAAFLVHYNAPKYFWELRNRSSRRMMYLSFSAVVAVILFCGSFAIMGFTRFGLSTPGNLLKGYVSAYAAWITTSVSLITTYPFDFDGGRRSVLNLIRSQNWGWSDAKLFWTCTLVMIPIFTTVSVLVENLSIVIGINGALFGITTGFTLPGLVLWRAGHGWVGLVIAGFGTCMSVLGLVSVFIHST
jgi:amino acid permease